MSEIELVRFGIGMYSVVLGYVGGMIILGYYGWFK